MASNVAQVSTRLILIGAAVLLSIGMGLRQSIGLFLTPVTRDLALTAADFTLTIAIQNIVWVWRRRRLALLRTASGCGLLWSPGP